MPIVLPKSTGITYILPDVKTKNLKAKRYALDPHLLANCCEVKRVVWQNKVMLGPFEVCVL